jgi:GT2 family glycosyltransferase
VFADFALNEAAAKGGIAFINPIFDAFSYARRSALSFFKYTPESFNPVCINVDDCSPLYAEQDWDYWYAGLPRDRCAHVHKAKNSGLTDSWNRGLRMARDLGCKYAIAGNSDICCTEGWYEGLLWHLDRGTRLVGPVTNAPGWTNRNSQQQNVTKFVPNYKVNDDPEYLQEVARYLKATYPIEKLVEIDINGFFTMSTLDFWWAGAYDLKHVFDPRYKLTGNEDELERRWKKKGWRYGFVPSSFVFHYRAVSRGNKYKAQGWARLEDIHKPV